LMKTDLCARLPVLLCLAVALLLASPLAIPTPMQAAAASWCASPNGGPMICEASYQSGSSTLILKGVAFMPNGRASVTVTGPNDIIEQRFTLQVSSKGRILALAPGLCYMTATTITAVDLKTGKHTPARALPICGAAVTQIQSGARGIFDQPQICDVQATTPAICATGFDGTPQTAGILSFIGTGFRPNEHVHVHVAASDVPAIIYADSADQIGMLFSSVPHKVPCTMNNVTVDVTDSSAKTNVHYTIMSLCITLPMSSSSGGSHSYWVPIGLIIAVGGTILRKLRRGNLFGG
ncbi:MAG: hypothetical protein JWO42_816, partial [Chloroflexi bacterium]|nr:hypothetical protein [Chloroflexota bacterium]